MRSTRLLSSSRRFLGFEAAPVPPHVFAVGEREVRYAGFAPAEGGLALRRYQAVELEEDLFGEGPLGGVLRDTAEFRGAVQELLGTLTDPPKEASLVVPDAWLRLSFAEVGDLPRDPDRADEMLRWKLKRLVPFRVEELRLDAVELPSLPGQSEPRRVLMGFGVDLLFRQIEDAFEAGGVRLGQLQNVALALLGAVAEIVGKVGLGGLVVVSGGGYGSVFVHQGEPFVHRFRALEGVHSRDALQGLVLRDLRLTRAYLQQRLPDADLERLLVLAPREEGPWTQWIAEGLGVPAVHIAREQLPLQGEAGSAPLERLAPMLGAAYRRVS